jgi:hypothetical protein
MTVWEKIKFFFGWRPERWCDRCKCVHEPPDPDFEEKLYSMLAKQIADEVDNQIMEDMIKEFGERK